MRIEHQSVPSTRMKGASAQLGRKTGDSVREIGIDGQFNIDGTFRLSGGWIIGRAQVLDRLFQTFAPEIIPGESDHPAGQSATANMLRASQHLQAWRPESIAARIAAPKNPSPRRTRSCLTAYDCSRRPPPTPRVDRIWARSSTAHTRAKLSNRGGRESVLRFLRSTSRRPRRFAGAWKGRRSDEFCSWLPPEPAR